MAPRPRSDRRGSLAEATPYREKVNALLAQGATTTSIAAATGLTSSAVAYIATGQTRWLRSYTSTALDGVTLADCMAATCGGGPSLGTVRRIRALLALGWTHAEMLRRTGVHTRRVICHPSPVVTARTRAAIAELYEELCMTPGPSEKNRARAARLGWVPPLAWDDIDDPDEVPSGVAA